MSDCAPVKAQLVFVTPPDFAAKHGDLAQTFVSAILGVSSTLYDPDGRAAFIRVAQANSLQGDGADHRGGVPEDEDFFESSGQIESSVPFAGVWDTAFWRHG